MKTLAALTLVLVTAGTTFAQSREMKWDVDGTERRALVYAPRRASGPVPVVFAFHGAGDTADNFSGVGFQSAWPEALVVYMEGLGRVPGGGGAFQTTDGTPGNRDLKFFDTAFADLKRQFRIDERRVYATGFSNGAKLVYLLWATRPDTFAAFAPVAGMLTAKLPLAQPKPFIHIGGREDHQNEFSEQVASVELGRATNGAAGKGASCGPNCTLYSSSRNAPVMTVLHPSGHIYPSDATTLVVKFFRAHP